MTLSSVGEKGATPNPTAVRSSRKNDSAENAGAHSSRPLGELPRELSSFVGREHEISEVKRLLGDTRLLTLTGPGGCGKTRLAMAVAFDVVESFEDGVWWVGLAPLSDPTLVAQEVASTLGVREAPGYPLSEALAEHLEHKRVLLILDNCEHLIDTCAALADALLRSCPNLRILATSREALSVAGETNWVVPSLTSPDPLRLPPVEELMRYEAVRLFVERAGAVVPGFELTEGNASAVAKLCHLLDGIPLAIELAAARTRALSVEQISRRLKDPLKLLTAGGRTAAPRHRTLRATLSWSYELLSDQERKLFCRLSAFAGGWTLEAAEAVGAGEGIEQEDVLDLLGRLVDKSLVVAGPGEGDAVRYAMLEPMRQYGRQLLQERAEAEDVGDRHAHYYLALAERVAPELIEPWLESLARERDNFRAAMRWLLRKGEYEAAARLGWALWRFWWIRGHFAEERRWMQEALEKGVAMPASARAKALFVAGTMAAAQAEYSSAEPLLEESLALFKELGDKRGSAFALGSGGLAAIGQKRRHRGIAYFEEGAQLFLELGIKWGAAYMLTFQAMVWLDQGDHAHVKRQAEQGVALFREVGERDGTSVALYTLGVEARASNEHERAREMFEEGLALATEVRNETIVAYCLEGLAAVAGTQGEVVRAARLWGAAEALIEEIEATAYPYVPDRTVHESQVSAARTQLDSEEAFAAAWEEGRAMARERAIAYALGETPEPPAEATPPTQAAPVPDKEEKKIHAELCIYALGQGRVEAAGHALTPSEWTYAKARELLFYLLSHPPRTREQIGVALWPDASPSQLRKAFHNALYHLRRALGRPEWVVHQGGRYSFEHSLGHFYDVEAFESKVAEARSLKEQAPAQAISHLKEAAELYRGDFLEEFTDSEWVLSKQEELRRTYLEALLDRGGLLFSEGRYAEAEQVYRKAISQDRYSEAAHRQLMRSLARMGERGRAIRHYEGLVGLLREELGSSPAPESEGLYECLRKGEEL